MKINLEFCYILPYICSINHKNMGTNTKKIKLSEKQWLMIKALREDFEGLWIGSVNRLVVNALIKKGLVRINSENDVILTGWGKSVEL